MNILKRLFCKHIYEHSRTGTITYIEPDFSGDGYNSWKERYTEYICTKCGKRKKVFE
jgi:hypothetical protein